jgi:hypothetical protein
MKAVCSQNRRKAVGREMEVDTRISGLSNFLPHSLRPEVVAWKIQESKQKKSLMPSSPRPIDPTLIGIRGDTYSNKNSGPDPAYYINPISIVGESCIDINRFFNQIPRTGYARCFPNLYQISTLSTTSMK